MIKLGVVFPAHLNLNGDFGNIQVLKKEFEWAGLPNEVVSISSAEDLENLPNFVLVGHGSAAAWADIDADFASLLPLLKEMASSGVPMLAINSGYEKLIAGEFFDGIQLSQKGERTSRFDVSKFESTELLGYLNSDKDIPTVVRSNKLIGSLLHGPLLAKNIDLLEEFLVEIATHAGVSFQRSKEKAGKIAGLVHEVWELERDLASE